MFLIVPLFNFRILAIFKCNFQTTNYGSVAPINCVLHSLNNVNIIDIFHNTLPKILCTRSLD